MVAPTANQPMVPGAVTTVIKLIVEVQFAIITELLVKEFVIIVLIVAIIVRQAFTIVAVVEAFAIVEVIAI